jgi:hypothetical protein
MHINSATPAAPSGTVNVVWRSDTSGNTSGNVPDPTVLPIRTVSANYTVVASDYTVVANTPSITVTLPVSSLTGKLYNVKNANSTTGQLITVAGGGSPPALIDTASTITLGATASLHVQWDGMQWRIL